VRSVKKGCFIGRQALKNLYLIHAESLKFFTGSVERNSVITQSFFFFRPKVHDGKKKKKIRLNNLHLKNLFGCNSFTRKPFYFPLKKLLKNLK
jgi:ribosomal protein S19